MAKDHRVKITSKTISYNGVLSPLANTNGVLFPYMPTIRIQYTANYSDYSPIHSNHRGLFYTSSQVENVLLEGTFTVQDSSEADYLRAVIHFFKSATKMFYGDSMFNGSPPAMVYMSGLGEYQFNNHSAVVSLFNYSSPSDVDFIPTSDNRDMMPTMARLSLTLLPLLSRSKVTNSSTESYYSGNMITKGYW